MGILKNIGDKLKKFGGSQSSSKGRFVDDNPWGIREGLSFEQVDSVLAQNGFEEDIVKLPGNFGPDPAGYKYPCWKNTKTNKLISTTFKLGKLMEFRLR